MIILLVVFVLTFKVEFTTAFNVLTHAIVLRWVFLKETFGVIGLAIRIRRIVTIVITQDICFYDARLSHFFAQVVLLPFQVVDDAFVVLGDLNIWLVLIFLHLL